MKRKILIIDDETDQGELLDLTFSYKPFMKSHQFLYVENARNTVELLKNNSEIDIALIDINMPDMDGLSLMYYIKQQYPLIQCVIISAYADMANIRKAMSHGAYDFVTKPIDMADLEKTLIKTMQQADFIRKQDANANEIRMLKEKALQLEMKALRAQMNPHFIFNSLNSINHFIQINDKSLATAFLLKFSKLIRMILEHSMHPSITLAKELEALALFVEMESLRFENLFTYEVLVDEEVDIDSLKVPPLILQPFVENAIKHGLAPNKQNGHLKLHISQHDQLLEIQLEDNGIGRANAAKNNNTHGRQSFGIGLTKERILMIKAGTNCVDNAAVTIEDLTSHVTNPGTKVTIKIPAII
jgi:LytS/YehU family sensor histidine kinase